MHEICDHPVSVANVMAERFLDASLNHTNDVDQRLTVPCLCFLNNSQSQRQRTALIQSCSPRKCRHECKSREPEIMEFSFTKCFDKWIEIIYRSNSFDQNITNIQPTFKREYLKQCQHCVADIIEIESSWIRPVSKSKICNSKIEFKTFKHFLPNSRHKQSRIRFICA